MTRLTHVCFFSGDATRGGGTERVVATIANELARRGRFTVSILSLARAKGSTFFEFSQKVSQYDLMGTRATGLALRYPLVVSRLRRFIREHEVDVIIDVDTILSVFSIPSTVMTGCSVVSWEHFNYFADLGSPLRRVGRWLASRYAHALVTITQEDERYFRSKLDPRSVLTTIYNPLTLIPRHSNASDRETMLLSVGRLTHQKGFDLLVEVASLVLPSRPEWRWVILGEGEDRPKLESLIAAHGLGDNVLLLGSVKDVAEFYRKASLFVLTSRFEGFGLVLTEAKAFGLPCVSFRCKAGPSEIVADQVNGYLVEPLDVAAMAQALALLMDDPKLRERFAESSLFDTEKFRLAGIVDQWEMLLEAVARND